MNQADEVTAAIIGCRNDECTRQMRQGFRALGFEEPSDYFENEIVWQCAKCHIYYLRDKWDALKK